MVPSVRPMMRLVDIVHAVTLEYTLGEQTDKMREGSMLALPHVLFYVLHMSAQRVEVE